MPALNPLTTLSSRRGLIAGTAGILALGRQAAARLLREDTPGVKVRKDVAYYDGPGADAIRHKLDLYLPEGKQDFPLMMYVHGGAWRSGSKEIYPRIAEVFVKRGIGVA